MSHDITHKTYHLHYDKMRKNLKLPSADQAFLWQTDTDYKINDIIVHNGQFFITLNEHRSQDEDFDTFSLLILAVGMHGSGHELLNAVWGGKEFSYDNAVVGVRFNF